MDKKYDKYISSGIPWMKEMPSHWSTRRAKYMYKKESRSVEDSDDVVTCFRDGTVTLRKNRRTTGFTESLKEIGYQGIRKGDLVIHVMDAFAGAIGVSDSDGKGTPVYSVCTSLGDYNNYYYAYILREMAKKGFIQSLYRGIRERSSDFRFDVFGKQTLPIPTREEQDQIVLYLDWQMSKINRLISSKKKKIKVLKEYRKATIDEGILHGFRHTTKKESGIYWLGEIPNDWDIIPIKRICKVNASISEKAKSMLDDELVTFLPMENVTVNGEVDCSIKKPIRDVRSGYSSFAKGDVVVAKITPCFENGKGACLDCLDTEIGYGTTEFINLRPSEKVLAQYLYLITMTQPFRKLGEEVMSGSAGQKRVPIEFIKNFTLGVPSVEEQREIIKELDGRLRDIDELIEKEKETIDTLHELRSKLISDVVTGQIDVRDIEVPEFEYVEEIEDSSEDDEETDDEAIDEEV